MTPLHDLLDAIVGLKAVDRAGWLRAGVQRPESVAAHSHGMAALALALCPPDLDLQRVLSLCILHDLPEAIVGDITPHDGISRQDKADAERSAAARLFAGRARLWALWEDYEKDRSEEAHFVHQLDKLDMGLQALRYAAEQGVDTAEFVDSARRGITRPELRAVLEGAVERAKGRDNS